jgi:hypothetical protein
LKPEKIQINKEASERDDKEIDEKSKQILISGPYSIYIMSYDDHDE